MKRVNEVFEYYEYVTVDGDRWDTLAYRYYNDSKKMDEIIKANPEVPGKLILDAGTKLRIPVIAVSDIVIKGAAPWKK
ncbi:MAG: tail protein X [bacterium]